LAKIDDRYRTQFQTKAAQFAATADNAKYAIKASIEAAKPADYETRFSNALTQINALDGDQIMDMTDQLKDRLSTFKDDPVARQVLTNAIYEKAPFSPAKMFDTSNEQRIDKIDRAKAFVASPSFYDHPAGNAFHTHELLTGLVYDSDPDDDRMTGTEKSDIMSEVGDAIGLGKTDGFSMAGFKHV